MNEVGGWVGGWVGELATLKTAVMVPCCSGDVQTWPSDHWLSSRSSWTFWVGEWVDGWMGGWVGGWMGGTDLGVLLAHVVLHGKALWVVNAHLVEYMRV